MLDIFLIFEIIYETWSLIHFISDTDEMNRFRSLSLDNHTRELKFRIFSFHAEGNGLLTCTGKMIKYVQL